MICALLIVHRRNVRCVSTDHMTNRLMEASLMGALNFHPQLFLWEQNTLTFSWEERTDNLSAPFVSKSFTEETKCNSSHISEALPHLWVGCIGRPIGQFLGGVRRQCSLKVSHCDGISPCPDSQAFFVHSFNSIPQHTTEIIHTAVNEFKLTIHESPVCSVNSWTPAEAQVEQWAVSWSMPHVTAWTLLLSSRSVDASCPHTPFLTDAKSLFTGKST